MPKKKIGEGNIGNERCQRKKMQKTNKASWAKLSNDIFSKITLRLPCLEDLFRLAAVCKSWNLSVNSSEKPSLGMNSPLLMVVTEKEAEGKSLKIRASMDKTDSSNVFLQHVWRLEVSPPQKRCFGIKYGWLLTVGMDLQICLVHPISGHQLILPPCPNSEQLLEPRYHYVSDSDSDSDSESDTDVTVSGEVKLPTLKNTHLWKAAMSSNPLENITSREVSNKCIVMGIFSDHGMLAFARPNDKVWTVVSSSSHNFIDVIYFRGKFCSVNEKGQLFVCHIEEGNPRAYKIASAAVDETYEKYLVEFSNTLFLVTRHFFSGITRNVCSLNSLFPWPTEITVHSLKRMSSYEESEFVFKSKACLGNIAFLLGASSVSLDARGIKGCFKRDRVLVTDDIINYPPLGMDVFDLENNTCEGFDFGKMFKSLSSTCPPFWYV